MNYATISIDKYRAKDPKTIDFALTYLEHFHTLKDVKAVTPYSFIIGTDADMELKTETTESLYWGTVTFDNNPNLSKLEDAKIELTIDSLLASNAVQKTVKKRITRFIESQNYLNECTTRFEFFKGLELTSTSPAYDSYATFLGFKIDL
ncbi:MAG: hypothetical protein [Bacteriophage sp.]|nr:MAG: hypothetical protein [Bacteriophage sp.]